MSLLPRAERDAAEGHASESMIVGTLGIEGAWAGSVALTAPYAFAPRCTAQMHQRPTEALAEGNVRHGWGELVNMVGGNLKALVACQGYRIRITGVQVNR